MIYRNPEEFAFLAVDLSPLIAASKANDWRKVSELLDTGYSLQWIDEELKDSAARLLIRESGSKEFISQLLDYSRETNGVNSAAHKYISIEATVGIRKINKHCPIEDIAAHSRIAKYYRECEALADMEEGDIGGLEADKEGYPVTAESIFHLARGGRIKLALTHLKWLYDKLKALDDHAKPRIQLYAGVTSLLRAAAQHGNIHLEELAENINVVLMKQHTEAVYKIAAIEAVANGSDEWIAWGFNLLEQWILVNATDLDNTIGEAIYSAARQGRGKIVFKLCQLAVRAKVDQSKRFVELLSYAAGAALVHDHVALTKILMKMIPVFKARLVDLRELTNWPKTKIEHMFSLIKDYKIFTDIAMHSGLDPAINSFNWTSALKNEYGLGKMSNAGFSALIHHPELLYVLLSNCHTTKIIPGQPVFNRLWVNKILDKFNNVNLSTEDVDHFVEAMNKANEMIKSFKPGLSKFFRLTHLVNPSNKRIASIQDMQNAIEIKEEISHLFYQYLNTDKQAYKEIVINLRNEFNDAVLPSTMLKILDKHLSKAPRGTFSNPLGDLLSRSHKVFKRHRVNINRDL